jgi:hypothetical protein
MVLDEVFLRIGEALLVALHPCGIGSAMGRPRTQKRWFQMGTFVDRPEGMPEEDSQCQLDRCQRGEGCCSETRIKAVKPNDIVESSCGVKAVFTV